MGSGDDRKPGNSRRLPLKQRQQAQRRAAMFAGAAVVAAVATATEEEVQTSRVLQRHAAAEAASGHRGVLEQAVAGLAAEVQQLREENTALQKQRHPTHDITPADLLSLRRQFAEELRGFTAFKEGMDDDLNAAAHLLRSFAASYRLCTMELAACGVSNPEEVLQKATGGVTADEGTRHVRDAAQKVSEVMSAAVRLRSSGCPGAAVAEALIPPKGPKDGDEDGADAAVVADLKHRLSAAEAEAGRLAALLPPQGAATANLPTSSAAALTIRHLLSALEAERRRGLPEGEDDPPMLPPKHRDLLYHNASLLEQLRVAREELRAAEADKEELLALRKENEVLRRAWVEEQQQQQQQQQQRPWLSSLGSAFLTPTYREQATRYGGSTSLPASTVPSLHPAPHDTPKTTRV